MVLPVVIAPFVCVEWATDVAVHVFAEQAVTVMVPSAAQSTVPPPE